MIKDVNVSYRDTAANSKELQERGYASAHMLSRRGYSTELRKLRKLAETRDDLDAIRCNISGTPMWYYRMSDIERLTALGVLNPARSASSEGTQP